jgi:hypothetical protein
MKDGEIGPMQPIIRTTDPDYIHKIALACVAGYVFITVLDENGNRLGNHDLDETVVAEINALAARYRARIEATARKKLLKEDAARRALPPPGR